jgi:four helix bundle protein
LFSAERSVMPIEPEQTKAATPKSAELSIVTKTFDMAKYAYPALAQFPKSEKFSIVADIKRCIDDIIGLEIAAQKKYFKKTTLQDLDIELTKLRYYIRLSMELGFLTVKKYEVWSEKLTELGKMLGGWIKSVNASKDAKSSS